MGGFFGVVSKENCVYDLYFGVDYHSHLGTRKGGMAVYTEEGEWKKEVRSLNRTQFRAEFENFTSQTSGHIGIGCISDSQSQPLIVRSKFGTFAITTIGHINNEEALVRRVLSVNSGYFLETEGSEINQTELIAMLINERAAIGDGIRYAQEQIDGSMSILVAYHKGIYCGRDLKGRTPVIIGRKENGDLCVTFESCAGQNLGYDTVKELGPGEVVFIGETSTSNGEFRILPKKAPEKEKKICAFLWTYYGYPAAEYEGVSVEKARYRCGEELARNDENEHLDIDSVDGIPDSGLAAAIGYANESHRPFKRAFVKYTPTWPRSFMPASQKVRDHIAHMKLLTVPQLVKDKKLLFIDDSIVRGTQLRDAADLLYSKGAKEVHIRTACPPIMFGCKYLNFSRSNSEMDLIARRVVVKLEGGVPTRERLERYIDDSTPEHAAMVEEIRKEMHFTSLKYPTLEMLEKAIGLPPEDLCTYCWNGKE